MTMEIQALCDQKIGQLLSTSILSDFTPYFELLKPTITRLYKLIQSSHDSGDKFILNHATITEALMDAFKIVTEVSCGVTNAKQTWQCLQKEPAPTGTQYYSEGCNAHHKLYASNTLMIDEVVTHHVQHLFDLKTAKFSTTHIKSPQYGIQHVFRGPCQGQWYKRLTRMSVRAAPSINHICLQVCDPVLVVTLMEKSCTKKHAMPQVADGLHSALNNPVVGSNTQKKTKMLPSGDASEQTHWSSRVNRGSSSQITQLQDIKYMQTQTIARISSSDAPVHVPPTLCLNSPIISSNSIHPPSQGHSATPVSQGRAPTNPEVTMPTPPVPLRSSQIMQQAYNSQSHPLSRTFSVHDLNVALQPQNFFNQDVSVTMPPPYYHAGKDGDRHGKFPISGDTDIDNISPNDNERMAEAALHTPAYHGQDKQDSQPLAATCPTDFQIDPALLAISEQHYDKDSDIYSQTWVQQDHPFEYGTYLKIFTGFLDMQHQIDQHLRHSAKMQELKVAWASVGRCKTGLLQFFAGEH
ncbi:hypothetical protein EDC04DRAFT_2604285 [Pisolithus marmoratus]|nr:hypothetical protein EDC04DRAFT_2604285 [Pisolithus marmoratus]